MVVFNIPRSATVEITDIDSIDLSAGVRLYLPLFFPTTLFDTFFFSFITQTLILRRLGVLLITKSKIMGNYIPIKFRPKI